MNGSFENYTNIDCANGGFDRGSAPFTHVVDNWFSYNSPDYFNSICGVSSWYNVPNNILGNSAAKANNSYAGISVFQENNSEYKEYIYQQFSPPLQAGVIYCLSFYLSKADRKEYSIKNIGAYFSNTLPSIVSNMYISVSPQIINQNGFLTDTTQWVEIQGCFTALGGEQYLTIGNFNSNANTDTLYVGTNNPISGDPQYAYYYIDDVTLIDQTTVGLEELSREHGFSVYPNPANGILNLNYRKKEKEDLIIKLVDVVGKEILIEKYKEVIDISNLENGIYFLSLYKDSLLIETKKVIKN